MRILILLALLVAPACAQLPQTCEVRGGAAFSPDGRYLAVPAGTVKKPGFRLWDLTTRRSVRFVPVPLTYPIGASVTRDGTLATSSHSKERVVAVEIWGQERKWSHQAPGDVMDFRVQWSPDGQQLASFSWGKARGATKLKVWSAAGVSELETWFLGWTGDNRLFCLDGQETIAVRAPGERTPLHELKLPGRALSYSSVDREGNLRCLTESEEQEEVYSPQLKLLRTDPMRPNGLGKTDLVIRTTERMGKGKATLLTARGKALGSWPQLYGSIVSPDETILALVVPDQVVLVDLSATARQQKLVLASATSPNTIVPGLGLGPYQLEAPAPDPAPFQRQGERWVYPSSGPAQYALILEGGKIARIEVYSPKFAVEGHPEVKVGCSRQAIFKALPKWTEESPGHVDYDGRGLRFKFTPPQDMVCVAIYVFPPGTSTESEPAQNWVVVADVLNGRRGPSLSAPVARQFKQGERLTASGPPVRDDQGGWWIPLGDGVFVKWQADLVRAVR